MQGFRERLHLNLMRHSGAPNRALFLSNLRNIPIPTVLYYFGRRRNTALESVGGGSALCPVVSAPENGVFAVLESGGAGLSDGNVTPETAFFGAVVSTRGVLSVSCALLPDSQRLKASK